MKMVEIFKREMTKKFDSEIASIILIGSLAGGSYLPSSNSNINLITVLENSASKLVKYRIERFINKLEKLVKRDIKINKHVYYVEELIKPFKDNEDEIKKNKVLVDVPEIVNRIIIESKIIYGYDLSKDLKAPSKEEVIKFLNLRNKFLSDNKVFQKNLEEPTTQYMCDLIIRKAMYHYYFYTGEPYFNKLRIEEMITTKIPNYKFSNLLSLALEYKLAVYEDFPDSKENAIKDLFKDFIDEVDNNKVDYVPLVNKEEEDDIH